MFIPKCDQLTLVGWMGEEDWIRFASWETRLGLGSIKGGYKLEGSQKIPRQAAYLKILPGAIPELQKRRWSF